MGLAPGLLPGRVTLDGGREWFAGEWPSTPTTTGLDTEGMLQAAADGRIDVLVLLGADPLADFPDHDLAERALAGARTVISLDTLLNASSRKADIVLAAAGFAEKAGTTTNIEGRVSTLSQRVTPPGTARPDWMLASELALRLGAELGFGNAAEILAEIGRVAPSHLGLALGLVEGTPDGVLLPLPIDAPPTDDGDVEAGDLTDEAVDTDTDTDAAEAEESGAVEGNDPEGPTAAPVPELVSFEAPARYAVPPVDAYSFRLVATRKLYDQGTLLQASSHLAGLTPGTVARVHPADADRLGLAAGDRIVIRSARTSLTLPLHPDGGVPRGAVALVINQPDVRVGDLVAVDGKVTEVRIEAAS